MIVPVVALDEVGLTYIGPPPVVALQPTTLTIDRGEYIAVVGRSGSGKSTLLNVLGLLDRPTTGTYVLDGIDVGMASERERTALRALRIGFVFQAFHLLAQRSALENVALGLLYRGTRAKHRMLQSADMLERVGLAHKIDAPPAHLSGGERQRVAIARALVGEPALLLCDEPTGNLDSENSATVLSLMREVHRAGQTVVVITHDSEVAAQAGRTIRLHDGLASIEAV